jgi:hypothetical protein
MWSSGSLSADWQRAEPHVIAALAHAGDTHEPRDVLDMIIGGRAALWVGSECAVVTQEIDLPRGVQLHFWLAGGDLDELMEIERDIEKAAHENGIVRVSIIGRRGWRAKLDGFKEAGVILVKEIK